VDVQDSRGGAESFIADHGITYPSLFDPAGAILTDQGALGLPVTIFVRADGSVASTVKGELSQASLDEGLAQIAT
jgi:cytochrome c biogenesis protein CcmG, thiol:disulfide interchange protein DsbE